MGVGVSVGVGVGAGVGVGLERLWEISAPLLDNQPPIQPYAPGSWGPRPALDHLTTPYHWHLPGSRSPGGRGCSLAARGRPGAG